MNLRGAIKMLIGSGEKARATTILWFSLLVAIAGITSNIGARETITGNGQASEVIPAGTVRTEAKAPVDHVMVTIQGPDLRASTVTVFSDDKGRFQFPAVEGDADIAALTLNCRKIGFITTKIGRSRTAGKIAFSITMKKVSNIADQVPASAWVPAAGGSNGLAHNEMIKQCAVGCHQMPWASSEKFASSIARLAPQERLAGWKAMLQTMRLYNNKFGGANSQSMIGGLTQGSHNLSDYFFTDRILNLILPFVTGAMPYNFDNFPVAKFHEEKEGGDGVTIWEYALKPNPDSWYREVGTSTVSPFVWVVDFSLNRLVKLDPTNGHTEYLPIPFGGPTYPHTINSDAKGNLWVTLEAIDGCGMFNPRSGHWTFYAHVLPKNHATHDFILDWHGQVAFDAHGQVWLTDITHNYLAALDPKTHRAVEYPLPPRKDGLKEMEAPYGAVMTPDREFIWFAQFGANTIGRLNLTTHKVDRLLQLPQASGPKRPTIDQHGMMWVNLAGTGQLLEYDTNSDYHHLYDLPDRASGPYAARLDPVRGVVWLADTNNDGLYSFDPHSKQFILYRLPRHGAFLRQIAFDDRTGDLWTSYANKVGDLAPNYAVRIRLNKSRGQ